MVNWQNKKGFTLIEMLLVLAIASAMLMMFISYTQQKSSETQRDHMVIQMQQILNAALSYYVSTGKWPVSTSGTWETLDGSQTLQTAGYLPAVPLNVPIGPGMTAVAQYQVKNTDKTNSSIGLFAVAASTGLGITSTTGTGVGADPVSYLTAINLATRLPLGFAADETTFKENPPSPTTTKCAGAAVNCYAVSEVNIPGQNLNNARSVNFAAIYSSGACVPVPQCPSTMKPQIIVAPVSVNGNYYGNTDVYPVSSFTAFAKAAGTPTPDNCDDSSPGKPCKDATKETAGNYWRACLSVTTQQGKVVPSDPTTAINMGSILAITRCSPGGGDKPAGTEFHTYSQ